MFVSYFLSCDYFAVVCIFLVSVLILSEQGPKAHTRSSHSRPCWRWVLCYHCAPEHMWNIMWTPLPSGTLKGGPWLVMPWIFLLSAYEGCSHLYYLRAPAEAVEPCTVCLLDWFLVKRISLHELLSDGPGALDQWKLEFFHAICLYCNLSLSYLWAFICLLISYVAARHSGALPNKYWDGWPSLGKQAAWICNQLLRPTLADGNGVLARVQWCSV